MNADEKHSFNTREKHEILWKVTDKKYRATHSKEPTWRRITEYLGSTGEHELIVNTELPASRKANRKEKNI